MRDPQPVPGPARRHMPPVLAWDIGIPPNIRPAIETALHPALAAAPSWCGELSVFYQTAGENGGMAEMFMHPEYRRASLYVYAPWLALTVPERAEVVQHEVVHLAVQPMKNAMDDLLEAFPDAPPPLQQWARKQFRRAMEGAVCDLTAAVCRARGLMVDGGPP